jgi:5-bromo-4-chloroindolyl phosphate hydrolysis protein
MGHSLSGLLGFAVSLIVTIFIIKMIVGLIILGRQKSSDKGNSPEIKLKRNMKNYRDSGLSDSDIKLFRETMAEAKNQIKAWETASKTITDVSVIEDVTGGLAAAKKTFQFIVKNPQELTKQNEFLYKSLPNMSKLIESYRKLQQEAIKSEKDLSETLLLMKTLSNQVAENYHEILMTDVKIIGKEVENG